MAVFATLKELFGSLVGPYLFMTIPLRFLPGTILEVLRTADLRIILSPSAFKDIWFSNFWSFMGPLIKANAEPAVISLLEGRVQNGKPSNDATNAPIGGVCLEVGAGIGMWADVFSKANTGAKHEDDGEVRQRKGGNGVTRVYGIEPNPKSAAGLRARVKEIGIDDIYEVLPVGIESLQDNFEPESVDCIVTILCLCSIPEPEKNIKLLYNSLKKGGRWYVVEHVQVDREKGFFLRACQWVTGIFWSQVMGSCRLSRPTPRYLKEAGPWEKIDLGHPAAQGRFAIMSEIIGTLTK